MRRARCLRTESGIPKNFRKFVRHKMEKSLQQKWRALDLLSGRLLQDVEGLLVLPHTHVPCCTESCSLIFPR